MNLSSRKYHLLSSSIISTSCEVLIDLHVVFFFFFTFRVNLANLVKKAMLVLLAHGYVNMSSLSTSREKNVDFQSLFYKIALSCKSMKG